MRKRKKQRKLILLVILLLCIGLGYALLTQDLTINGITKVKGNTWDIHFDNVQINSNSVSLSTGDSAATIDSNDDTLVNFTITLNKPGDFYEFTVDAVNEGTIDGMIGELALLLNGSEISDTNPLPIYLDYLVSYNDDVGIELNHLLAAGDTETYKVRVEFIKDIENDELPTTDQTNTFSFSIGYTQSNTNAVTVHHLFMGSGTKYTINSSQSIQIGERIPYGITLYDTLEEASEALSEEFDTYIPFALKHTIVNGIVTESYVEFQIENISGTVGTYTLRGGVEYNNTTQPTEEEYINNSLSFLRSIFGTGSQACRSSGVSGYRQVSCYSEEYTASIGGIGYAIISKISVQTGREYKCEVYVNASSRCSNELHTT